VIERTAGGLILPDDATLMEDVPPLPPFAKPIEPVGAGLRIDSGFSSAYFVTDPEQWLAILDQPRLFIQDRALDLEDLIAPLEVAAHKAAPIVVIAPALTVRARALLIINKLRGVLFASAIETQLTAEVLAYSSRHGHITRVSSGVHTSLVE
jgi:hypothetical protein